MHVNLSWLRVEERHATRGLFTVPKSRTEYGRHTVLQSHDYMELYSTSSNCKFRLNLDLKNRRIKKGIKQRGL
jgi:hypothetical protein